MTTASPAPRPTADDDIPPEPCDGTVVQDEPARERSRELSRQTIAPPARVPGYDILRRVGEGSFGSVWLAREVNTGKQVAIKFYSHRRGLDWSLLSREVEKLAVLYTSRNVVGLLEVGWEHDPPYFVMEYLENGSLAARLEDGPLPPEDAVLIAKSIARALIHAHGSGILHCDVKPANVLLDRNFEPRLGDFGQSRLSEDQSPALGTMFYMAPEQADLDAVPDARWDVYALGAVLYQMLTGQAPYRTPVHEQRIHAAGSLMGRLQAYREVIQSSPPPDGHRQRLGVDRRLADIVDRCLDPNPRLRYPNVQVVLDSLEQREQARAKRPLIALGFLGPILFLLAMFWIARSAVPQVVEAAENNLIDRALASDQVAAAILADSVERELSIRLAELEQLSTRDELREFLRMTARTPRENWSALPSPLNRWCQETGERLKRQGRTSDQSWFLTNAQGDQVAREPVDDTIGRNFAYRSYFHGGVEEIRSRGVESSLPGGAGDAPPVARPKPRSEPGISTAFRSAATNQYMVALAVPVWDESQTEVLGVMARTIHLTELLAQWEFRVRGQATASQRFLALIDTRPGAGFLLDHEWMTEQNMQGLTDVQIEQKLRLPESSVDVLRRSQSSATYADPIAAAGLDPLFDGVWLAAFAPVESTGWVAVVQESRGEALKPVDALRSVFVLYGVAALLVFSVMLGILWYLIHRAST
jgi:hypothetical protein